MGLILAYFRRPKLDVDRIRAVWTEHINGNDEYFQEVIRRICARNAGVRCAMLAQNAQHAESAAEEEFVLSNLADRISNLFHQMLDDEDVVRNTTELKRTCYDLGRQHAAYSKKQFKMSYWEEFTLTMMDVLEQHYPDTSKEEQKAWLNFQRFFNENMLDGYLDALSYNNKG